MNLRGACGRILEDAPRTIRRPSTYDPATRHPREPSLLERLLMHPLAREASGEGRPVPEETVPEETLPS